MVFAQFIKAQTLINDQDGIFFIQDLSIPRRFIIKIEIKDLNPMIVVFIYVFFTFFQNVYLLQKCHKYVRAATAGKAGKVKSLPRF